MTLKLNITSDIVDKEVLVERILADKEYVASLLARVKDQMAAESGISSDDFNISLIGIGGQLIGKENQTTVRRRRLSGYKENPWKTSFAALFGMLIAILFITFGICCVARKYSRANEERVENN